MKLIILNHKMNLYYEDVDNYIDKVNQITHPLIIAPTSIYLTEFIHKCHHITASQDICYAEDGNHTGKVSWKQIKHLGIMYSLIGHSEKHDDINKINTKLKVCLENDITPILCFGNNSIDENPIDILEKLDITFIDKIIFAYEPIFNIGSENISLTYIRKQIDDIYHYLYEKYHREPVIIYGGGINNINIKEIYHIDKLKGILIGGISSNADEITKLIMNISKE